MIRVFLLSLIMVVMITSQAFAVGTAPSEDLFAIGGGAKSLSMGKAYVVSGDDLYSAFYNPAGIANLKHFSLTSTYSTLLEDIKYNTISIGNRFGDQSIGFGYTSISTQVPLAALDANNRAILAGNSDYTDSIIYLTYGRRIGKLMLGTNLKYFSQNMSNLSSANGITADIGMIVDVSKNISLGISQQNAISTGLKWATGNTEKIESATKLGIETKFIDDILIAELDANLTSSKPGTANLGIAWNPFKFLSLRSGLNQVVSSNIIATYFTAGVGLNVGPIQIDYAYCPMPQEINSTSHFISFTINGNEEADKKIIETKTTTTEIKPILIDEKTDKKVIINNKVDKKKKIK